jgi:hypothetical protein
MRVNDAYFIAMQAGVTPVAIGDSGVGKTKVAESFAGFANRRFYGYQPSMHDATDICGCPFPESVKLTVNGGERDVTVTRIASPEWAARCYTDGPPWIIFLDELTTTVPIVQASLLGVIAEHRVGEIPLPANTWTCGAANPPEKAANGTEMCAPLANRVYHHNWEVDRDAHLLAMASGWDFSSCEYPIVPDDWEKHIPSIGQLFAAFHKRNPGRLDMEPDDPAEQSGPWPSQRTWEYLGRARAAATACGSNPALFPTLAEGLIGPAVSLELQQYEKHLDLADPEELLAGAKAELDGGTPMDYHHPDRPDKTMAMLSSVAACLAREINPKRWEAAMLVIEKAAEHDLEMALASAKPIACQRPKGVRISADFVGKLFPRIQVALGLG